MSFNSIQYEHCRERLAEEYDRSGELLVELGSDQTSCHNPFLGGYYPAQVGALYYLNYFISQAPFCTSYDIVPMWLRGLSVVVIPIEGLVSGAMTILLLV